MGDYLLFTLCPFAIICDWQRQTILTKLIFNKRKSVSDIYTIAPNISAGFFVLLGVFGFAFPNLAAAFVGLKPISAEGISEMRATLGSFFLGLGIACLWLQSPVAFTTLGIASVIAAIARFLSLFIDRSFSIKNVGGVFTEAILGAMLLLSGN